MPNRIVLALDGLTQDQAFEIAYAIGKDCYALKVHDLVDKHGPQIIRELKDFGCRVWVDHKLHDIPATVKSRASAMAFHGADIITVHASGGIDMIRAALESKIIVFAVTVLTSLTYEEAKEIYNTTSADAVLNLATTAKLAGAHGVVCSPLELALFGKYPVFADWEFVTPGVRSLGAATHDQKRVGTPKSALTNGATRLVIGRQIVQAQNPKQAFDELVAEISS